MSHGPNPSKQSVTSRYYRDEHDLLEMQRLLMEARSRTDDWHYPHVGELQFAFFMVLCHLNPQEHIRLWHDDSEKLIGFAILGEEPSLEWQVAPEYEWSGIETEALSWAEARLSDLRARDPKAWGGRMVSGSRQDNAQRIAFLLGHGFLYSGDFAEVNMLRSLHGPIPDTGLPTGFVVREVAESGEIAARAAAQREVWQPWTVGNVSDADYARLMQLPGYYRDLDVVAVAPHGKIAAYVNGWIDPVNGIGDFGPVGCVAQYRRLGLTRAVLLEGLRRMHARGMDRVCISTTQTNTPAHRLYRSIGFRTVNKYLDYVRAEDGRDVGAG